MIQFGSIKTAPLVRQMWKTVFEDTDEYVNIYFSHKYKDENTLVYIVDGEPVASLQMWEYNFSFCGKVIPIYYLAGLCTYEAHRRKGYMEELIAESHRVMKERKIPLSILIPAEKWLFTFYEHYGYTEVFKEDEELIPIQKILERNTSLENAFEMFDRLYNKTDFTVLKNFEQFKVIVEEQQLTGFEDKTNLSGVARLIDVEKLLQLYAKKNPIKKFTVRVTGDKHIASNNAFYTIEEGTVSKFDRVTAGFELDIIELCQLLMGQDNEELESNISNKFPHHKPIMNLMLE